MLPKTWSGTSTGVSERRVKGGNRRLTGQSLGSPPSAQQSRIHCQCTRLRFNPWVRKVPWRRKWQPTPVFLPGKSPGQRHQAGYSPWGCKELDTTERLQTHTHIFSNQSSSVATCFTYYAATKHVNTHIQDNNSTISNTPSNSDLPRFPSPWLIANPSRTAQSFHFHCTDRGCYQLCSLHPPLTGRSATSQRHGCDQDT